MLASAQKNGIFLWRGWPHLLVLLFAFLAGAVCGFFAAFLGCDNKDIHALLVDFFESAENRLVYQSFLPAVFECLRWPLLVLIFSFHPFGTAAIPMIICARGFLLSYAIQMLSLSLPGKGILLSAVLFSTTILLIVPTLFLWGFEGIRSIAEYRTSGSTQKFRIEVVLIGIGALFIAIAVQWALIPFLFHNIFT